MPSFGGILMKRLAYGVTIGLVGVLAAVAVKFPATQEVYYTVIPLFLIGPSTLLIMKISLNL